ncbi:hypothetical protein [Roseovarius mucosus]|uniref:hypothetical protein n=1 Tax=Roseovarius mucosus TaxID=215743 RepID=UPI003BA85117
MNEWGIPDWRDAEAYGDIANWSMNRWRWEFYRRRDDLREYFDKYADKTVRDNVLVSKQSVGGVCRRADEPGFVAWGSEDPRQLFEYIGVPNPRIGAQPEGVIRPLKGYSKLLRKIDGAKLHEQGTIFQDICERLVSAGVPLSAKQERQLYLCMRDNVAIQLKPTEVALKFDMDDPLEPQLKEAKEMLRPIQSERHGKVLETRRHPTKWLRYLRTLDAKSAGASWSEIAMLHPATAQTEQTVCNVLNQANALRFNFRN